MVEEAVSEVAGEVKCETDISAPPNMLFRYPNMKIEEYAI